MDTTTLWKRVRHVGQAWLFNLIYSHLKAARTRAAAHMSLHRQSQFQRSNQTINRTAIRPSKFSFEKLCYPSMLATVQCSVAAAPRPVKTPLSASYQTVNSRFETFLPYRAFSNVQPHSSVPTKPAEILGFCHRTLSRNFNEIISSHSV